MSVKGILKNIYLFIMDWGIFNWMPDKVFLKLFYKAATGKKLNIDNPQTFNEKIQWMKLYDRKPIYVQLADKYEVRKYVESKIGNSYLIPLIAHWNTCSEIIFSELPSQFVLKCTHDSGGLVICKDKSRFNKVDTVKKLNKCLKRNFYHVSREWAYKDIKPRVICEQYLSEDNGDDVKDYKFFCFNGEPKMVQVDFDRYTNHGRNIYTANWEFINLSIKCPNN
ncbi:MAG TPA: ATP-grasp fold amidoligase family protein, partial [Bacillota bacterium]|nr:ATP-grasp fold amidoligase family protein [Bacillota bacterium]